MTECDRTDRTCERPARTTKCTLYMVRHSGRVEAGHERDMAVSM